MIICKHFYQQKTLRTAAKLLDYRRLGKQRVEGLQLINSLSPDYDKKGWASNSIPARLMWVGYENALKHYTNIMIEEVGCLVDTTTHEVYKIERPIVLALRSG